jgi:hypothetical protein
MLANTQKWHACSCRCRANTAKTLLVLRRAPAAHCTKNRVVLDEIADRLKAVRESGKPEEFAFHQGRQRSKDALKRFLDAFGTNTQLSHRALCSGNRRAANLTYLWESDWDLNDVENSKYILNFGSNAFEAHQGHVPFATRIQNGRFKNGAKLVTLDVRLSNTAGASDEWFAPFPGTDGAIALAMAHAIIAEGLHDADFINQWSNVTVEELRKHLKPYTPEWAAKISGMPAVDIRRIAVEFAKAAPACTTMCNRGSSAHINGFYNDRAIQLLNGVVGSVGKKGGWCWSPWSGLDPVVKTPRMPPAAKTWSMLEDPPEYPLANVWRRMRVGELIYLYLLQGRAKLQAYMTYNLDSPLTWPEESLTQEWASSVPENAKTGKKGLERLMEEGVWESERKPYYEPYNVVIAKDKMQGARVDESSGIIMKDGIGIGIMKNNRPVRGFATPSRKFEIHSLGTQYVVGRQIGRRGGEVAAKHGQRLESKPTDAHRARPHQRTAVVS